MTTNILALTDARGNLTRFRLRPGQYDRVEGPPLIADKAFDSDALVAELDERGAKIVTRGTPAGREGSRSMPRFTHSAT